MMFDLRPKSGGVYRRGVFSCTWLYIGHLNREGYQIRIVKMILFHAQQYYPVLSTGTKINNF